MKRIAAFAVAAAAMMMASVLLAAERCDSFTIMSFNICHCATNHTLSVTDEEVRRTAAKIVELSPDFVCLQEVDDKTTRSNGIDETARIAELCGMHGVFGKARDYQGGGYGVAILSKEEPLSVTTRTVEGNEARLLLICEFADFCVANIHLDNNRTLRLQSVPMIREELAKYSKPVFLAGDWNATPDSDTLALLKEFMTVISPEHGIVTLNSQIGVRDEYVIDYIAVDSAHREDFYVRRAWCIDNRVDGIRSSDHDAVAVDVVKVPATLGWVEENAITTGRTGTWDRPVEYAAGTMKADLVGNNAFTPRACSIGDHVTMIVTAAFENVPYESVPPPSGAQGAVWLGTNGCFQAWTKSGDGSGNCWVDVFAAGVTPATGVDYTFRFVFDYANDRYSISVLYGGGYRPLEAVGMTAFPLAAAKSDMSSIRFTGDGVFTSLLGECENVKVPGFRMMIR